MRALEHLDLQDRLLETERLKKVDEQLCQDIDAVLLARHYSKISDAILDVLDEGNEVDFAFYHPFEGISNESRLMFRDRVLAKLKG